MNLRRGILSVACGVACLATPALGVWYTNDSEFLEHVETTSLNFFLNEKYGDYDLLTDNAAYTGGRWSDWCSVAGVGFEMTAVCLGHYRGWISYSNAYEQVLQMMRGFSGQLNSDPEFLKRDHGWTYHWYNLWTGYENSPDGLSLLDHSLFIAGCIFVSEYFKGTEAGVLADELYEQTQWSWRGDGDYDFGYSENLLAVVECAEAPAFKKTSARTMWESYNEPYPRTLQLYFWQYPHCWVDFRFRWDGKGRNHAEIARDSILYQRQRAIDLHNSNTNKYDMIGSNVWGWTAASASEGYRQMAPWGLWLGGTWYDDEHASDSGSVTPFALPPCMIYAGTETMAAMKYIFDEYCIKGWDPGQGEMSVWSDTYGFLNCFNHGKPSNAAKSNHYWGVNAGIDYGPNVLMLENYKMGATWRWFMQNPHIAAGMYTLGFGAPNQVTAATFADQTNQFTGGPGIGGNWDNDGSPPVLSYVSTTNNDYAVRIVANSNREGAWIVLGDRDQRAQAQLTFRMKSDSGQERILVGLKDKYGKENKVALEDYAGGMPTNWTDVKVPLEKFCLTSVLANDTWLEGVSLLSFEFTNAAGGAVEIDDVAFTKDTRAPPRPTNWFGVAQAGSKTRVTWDPSTLERDVVGYHVWRRYNSTSGFVRVTSRLVPAYLGFYEDSSNSLAQGREIRYAIQAFDNSEPQNSSSFSLEKHAIGGRLDIDWNNGRNPNTFGGTGDNFYGSAPVHSFDFVYTNLPDGGSGWARRSTINGTWSGHYIDLNGGDASAHAALGFYVKGAAGGEQLDIGLRDTNDHERVVHLDSYLDGGAVGTGWTRALIPLSEFTNVNLSTLRNLSFLHEAAGDIAIADIGFLDGQRSVLIDSHFTEAENWTRQYGSPTQDLKAAASGGKVLGQGWSIDGGDYADYEFFVSHPLTTPTLRARYACSAGDGRALEVRWNEVVQGSIVCTNTGGWGDSSNDFGWATIALPSITSGFSKLTFYANGYDDPVNLDCWELVDSRSAARECEDFDSQVGSGGQDLKAGASGGEVLGDGWGAGADSEAVYADIDAGAQTGAWLHIWYACYVANGRVVNVYIDGQYRARLNCARTPGWGSKVSHFDRASARIGALSAGTHTIRFAVPGAGDGINLDCFYVGDDPPEALAQDADGDGLSDRQEGVAGTLAAETDTDGDGISDGDEVQFGQQGQVSDPKKADTDDDGMSDLAELISGTDPNNEAELFQCLEISATNFPSIGRILRWPSATGRFYSVYAVTNLLTSDLWLLTSGLPATPSINAWTDTVSPDSPMLIYRIDAHR